MSKETQEWIKIAFQFFTILSIVIGLFVTTDRRISKLDTLINNHLADPSIHHGKINKLESDIVTMKEILAEIKYINLRLENLEAK